MYLKAFINGYRVSTDPHGAEYTNFCVEVIINGRKYEFDKRYSEFEELHKKVRKLIATPPFPPKRFLNKKTKVIEDRMEALQAYLQAILVEEEAWDDICRFFGLSPSILEDRSHCHVHPIGMFTEDPFLPSDSPDYSKGEFTENIIYDGVRTALYGGDNSDGD